jgi:YD repeat-containing protein
MVITGLDYESDPTGNRMRMREATGRLTTWSYDETYQLINEHRSSTVGGFNTTHVYDPVGNRLVKSELEGLTTSTFDVANQLVTAVSMDGTTTFTFDAAGNQQIDNAPSGITTNVWDFENQRTAVLLPSGERETMTYNADLRLVRRDP